MAGPVPFVGNCDERRFNRAHEQHAAKMRCCAYTGIGDRRCILVGLGIFDQPLKIGWLKVLARNNRHRNFRDKADIFERIQRVIGKLAVERSACGHADMVKQKRIAIWIGGCDPPGTECATCAADILDDNLLSEILDMDSATSRVTVSVGPPAEKGTTMVIVRSG